MFSPNQPLSARLGYCSRRRLSRGWFVVRGIHDDRSPWAFPVALSAEIAVLTQRKMKNTPLPRGHGREAIRRSRAAHFFRSHRRRHAKLLHPYGALILAIKGNLLMLS